MSKAPKNTSFVTSKFSGKRPKVSALLGVQLGEKRRWKAASRTSHVRSCFGGSRQEVTLPTGSVTRIGLGTKIRMGLGIGIEIEMGMGGDGDGEGKKITFSISYDPGYASTISAVSQVSNSLTLCLCETLAFFAWVISGMYTHLTIVLVLICPVSRIPPLSPHASREYLVLAVIFHFSCVTSPRQVML